MWQFALFRSRATLIIYDQILHCWLSLGVFSGNEYDLCRVAVVVLNFTSASVSTILENGWNPNLYLSFVGNIHVRTQWTMLNIVGFKII